MNDTRAIGDARGEVGRRGLVAAASAHLTETIALRLPFESLGPFKTLLKRYFSDEPWTADDAAALSALVAPHVPKQRWSLDLADDLTLTHEVVEGGYSLAVTGSVTEDGSLWDRVFTGPIVPEPTPHPQKVKFTFGGDPAPGVWYLRGGDPDDDRVRALLAEDDVTDVMVAGSFVTIGLEPSSRWKDRLDDLLALVGRLFAPGEVATEARTRDELIGEGRTVVIDSEHLHLLDADHPDHRQRLEAALADEDPRVRRVAVAVLAGSGDAGVADDALEAGRRDRSLLVRRMAIDAAADAEDERHRPLLEAGLADGDPWTRWRSVRALADLGLATSREAVAALEDDRDFQVRFEVARVLRRDSPAHG